MAIARSIRRPSRWLPVGILFVIVGAFTAVCAAPAAPPTPTPLPPAPTSAPPTRVSTSASTPTATVSTTQARPTPSAASPTATVAAPTPTRATKPAAKDTASPTPLATAGAAQPSPTEPPPISTAVATATPIPATATSRPAPSPTPPLATPTTAQVSFARNVLPIFQDRCVRCHSGPNAPWELHLTSYENVMKGSVQYEVIVPGNPKESFLYQYIDVDYMPLGGPPLTQEQKAIIRAWIQAGAPNN